MGSTRNMAADFIKMHLHGPGIGTRQEKCRARAPCRTDGPEYIGVLITLVSTHYLGRSRKLCLMDNCRTTHEHPVIAIETLNTNAVRRENDSLDHFHFRLTITGHHVSAAQILDDGCFPDCKWLM